MTRTTVCLGLLGAFTLLADSHLVSIGDRRLYANCSGPPSTVTVILINGLGAGLEAWKPVQSEVEKFARVCSYDRAGEGQSDKVGHLQTPVEVANDLSLLLDQVKLSGPYILVGWSLGGIYARDFAQRHRDRIAGIVLVDSAHEEQYNHYAAISPAIAERSATQDGRFDRDEYLRASGQLKPGEHLGWHLDVPLIVLEHSRLSGPPRTEEDRLAVDWHQLQVDLAGRSKLGKLIEARSGHMIATERPEIVVQSIREVIADSRR